MRPPLRLAAVSAIVALLVPGAGRTQTDAADRAAPAVTVPSPATDPVAEADAAPEDDAAATALLPRIDGVFEIAVDGATALSADEIATVVYPFLGPDKTERDVAAAREALERAYFERGYQVVAVTIPAGQSFAGGLARLSVDEYRVGRLRVRNARFTSPELIRERVPSLAEGEVVNIPRATEDLAGLATLDRRVDFVPGPPDPATRTVDVDLVVDETLPLHGQVELNNRSTEDTKPLRLNASVRYDNLFQLGHSINAFYQVAPQRRPDSEFFAAGYSAPVPGVPRLSAEVFGFISNSDVATVGGTSVVGNGFSVGGRATWELPGTVNLFHQASLTLQYKNFEDLIAVGATGGGEDAGGEDGRLPISYMPVTAGYFASLSAEDRVTTVAANAVFAFREIGSSAAEFEAKRAGANASFIYATLSADHRHTLPYDIEVSGRATGQAASGPLINNEQLSVGGLSSVRGFFETVALGDYGVVGGVEVRSPSIGPALNKAAGSEIVDEWRVYGFLDGATAAIVDPLPEQVENVRLVSLGFGSRFKVFEAINGSIDVAWPIVRVGVPESAEKQVYFTLSAGM